jgi:hypothetical protein
MDCRGSGRTKAARKTGICPFDIPHSNSFHLTLLPASSWTSATFFICRVIHFPE